MPRVLDLLKSRYRIQLERHRNRPFLGATMAAFAAVAIADGDACRLEGARVRQILRTLRELKLFDTDEGINVFLKHVSAIRNDGERGQAGVREAVRAGAQDAEAGALLVLLCRSVSEADGRVTDDERAEMARIARILGLEADAADALGPLFVD
jgi:tellurite resistance protein TerB